MACPLPGVQAISSHKKRRKVILRRFKSFIDRLLLLQMLVQRKTHGIPLPRNLKKTAKEILPPFQIYFQILH
jgi:hypothetical protein